MVIPLVNKYRFSPNTDNAYISLITYLGNNGTFVKQLKNPRNEIPKCMNLQIRIHYEMEFVIYWHEPI